jgi:hypothetical protein
MGGKRASGGEAAWLDRGWGVPGGAAWVGPALEIDGQALVDALGCLQGPLPQVCAPSLPRPLFSPGLHERLFDVPDASIPDPLFSLGPHERLCDVPDASIPDPLATE